MTIIRAARRRRYTVLDRELRNDSLSSFRALGILAYILDKPDNWRIESNDLAASHREGRDAVRSALTELEEHGYLVRSKVRDDQGKIRSHSVISEVSNRSRETGAWETGAGFPGGNTNTGNEDCKEQTPPTPQKGGGVVGVDGFDDWWKRYPRKVDRIKCARHWNRMAVAKRREAEAGLEKWIVYWDANAMPDKIPHPSTWLNNERWDADPPPPGKNARVGEVMQAGLDFLKEMNDGQKNR